MLFLLVPEERAVVGTVVGEHGIQGGGVVVAAADGRHSEVQILELLGHLLLESL